MSKASELVREWREAGPVAWASSPHGWLDVDGAPIRLEAWQRAVLAAWWAHRDAVSTLAVSNIKKTGKTTINAVLLAWRWLTLPGEHFACGNDFDQSAGRQFEMIAAMVRRHPYLRRNVKVGRSELVFTPTGSTIKALSVDAAGNAGANHLTASFTEAWGIVYEAGVRAYEELTPPPGRTHGLPALRICDSCSGYEGESTTWHGLVDRGLAGERVSDDWPVYRAGGLLLFHIAGEEAQARCFRGNAEEAAAYYAEQKITLRPGAYMRLHENVRSAGESRFIEPGDFDACRSPDVRRNAAEPGTVRIWWGVDAATKRDTCAAVGVYFDRSLGKIVLHDHRIWKPGKREPIDLAETVGKYLLEQRRRHTFGKVYFDPYQMAWLLGLGYRVLRPFEFPQTPGNQSMMTAALLDVITQKRLLVYNAPDLREHVVNAILVESPRGERLAKEKTSRKIDGAVALAMAVLGCLEHDITLGGWQREQNDRATQPAQEQEQPPGPVRLRVGARYRNGAIGVDYAAGAEIGVSEELAAYLVRDVPGNFQILEGVTDGNSSASET